MRSDGMLSKNFFGTDKGLTDAVNWFKNYSIPLYGVQKNPEHELWTTSPKAYGNLIIDDTCLGIPLIKSKSGRKVVHWSGLKNY